MKTFELSEREAAVLVKVLESYLADLKTERIGTDNREWHAELKDREALLGGILERLGTVAH